MHKKGPAVRRSREAAPAPSAAPCGDPPPTRPRPLPLPRRPPPYLGRLPPAAGVVPGGGAAVVVHEERPAGLGVHLDLPAGGQRLGAALALEQRGVSGGGAHDAAGPCAECRAGSGSPAALSAAGRGAGGGTGLEVSGNRRRPAEEGKGEGTETKRRRRGREGGRRPSCPAGNFWWPPARRAAAGWGCPSSEGQPPVGAGRGFWVRKGRNKGCCGSGSAQALLFRLGCLAVLMSRGLQHRG